VRLSGKDLKLYSCMIIILPLEVKQILPSLNYPFTSLEIALTVVLHEA